jgi:type IV pilus assembly protein PilY1
MKSIKVWLLASVLAVCSLAHAQIPPVPPNITDFKKQPMVVLNMSKDHQLFYRAYNEYTDIDFDGIPDTSYKHSIDYYGYFDSYKCYNYVGGLFTPTRLTADKYCAGVGNGSAGQWSGNFLNWATMARIDVVRKVLYGGYRSTDTAGQTVLERSYLPNDAHSFAKYYNGSDLPKLTPFSATDVAPRTVPGVFATRVGGITICNTTLGSTAGLNRYSQTNTNPPLMRVARGDFSLWNANERWQCLWSEEKAATNGNTPALTGLAAASNSPSRATFGIPAASPDFNVRVEVCNAAFEGIPQPAPPAAPVFKGKERCTKYPSGNYKPIGLMHEFGALDQAEFALITGSFTNNIAGGVLRRNMNSFLTEFNKDTDGTFNTVQGIAYTLNKMRIYGYDHNDGTYAGDVDNTNNWCTFQITGLSNNQCTSWGNPMGEMYLESVRYLAGMQPTTGFSSGIKDTRLGLPTEDWQDPYTRPNLSAAQRLEIERKFGKAQCRPMSVLNFNATAISYDADNLSGLSQLGDGSGNINNLLNTISGVEGISGTQRLVGRIAGGTAAETNRLCDLKTVNSLANVDGLCPDAPAYRGSYSLAGLAYWAHTNRIRTDYPATKKGPLTVDTYSIALNPGVPVITVQAQDGSGNKVLIQPAYRLQKNATEVGGGTLVDFRIVTQTPTYGKYLIVWEDSEQGGDYDQDVTGILEYRVTGNQLRVTTLVFAAATVNPQGFGYILSGSNKNGAHFHSGILNFNFNDPTNANVVGAIPGQLNATGGCRNCTNSFPPAPSTATYTITGGTLGALPDPLLLAAKWGGFKDSETAPTRLPGDASRWDIRKQDGSPGADGIPDNYSVVYNPALLEDALRSVFGQIIDKSNSAPAISFPLLQEGSLKYTVDYSSETLSGKLVASVLKTTPSFTFEEPSIFGHIKLTAVPPNLRQVMTNVGMVGAQFTSADIAAKTGGANYLNSLGGTATATTALIEYMRGNRSQEAPNGGLRKRAADSILGGIINSNPWIQGTQTFSLFGAGYEGYGAFGSNVKKAGDVLLWVGANDGMLHAFKAKDLTPVLSYVPEPLAPNVKKFADPNITSATALMDGNPVTADINLGTDGKSILADWRTYLFSPLGRGAKGVFALDVTNTNALTQGNAANIFKWQFTDVDDVDLGYVIADGGTNPDTGQAASVARLRNNRFAYIFGNGVNSASGKAVLYILYIQGPATNPVTKKPIWTEGTHFRKITLDSGTGNGLMQPLLVDTDDNGIMDTVYAGDLKGNMWRVSIESATPGDWKLAYDKPLYTAKAADNTTTLAITGAPSVAFHPEGGQVVVFATGKSIFTSDFPNTAVQQRIYGIWDRPSRYTLTPNDIPTGTSELVERVWTVDAVDAGLVQTDKTAIDWNTKKGWFANIPYSSGMAIHNTLLAKDGTTEIGIPLIYPTAGNVSVEVCANTVNGAYVQIDAIQGIQSTNIFGANRAGFSTTDQNFTLARYDPTVGSGPAQAVVGNTELKVLPPRARKDTRLYWREIPGIRTLTNPDTDRQ